MNRTFILYSIFFVIQFSAFASTNSYLYQELVFSKNGKKELKSRNINCSKISSDFSMFRYEVDEAQYSPSREDGENKVDILNFSRSELESETIYTPALATCSAPAFIVNNKGKWGGYLAHSWTGVQNYLTSTKSISKEIQNHGDTIEMVILHMSIMDSTHYASRDQEYDASICYILNDLEVPNILVIRSFKEYGISEELRINEVGEKIEYILEREDYSKYFNRRKKLHLNFFIQMGDELSLKL